MDLGLKGKVVAVAGGSEGMGYHVALEAAQAGARVAIGSRDMQKVGKATASIAEAAGSEVFGDALDVSDQPSIHRWMEKVLTRFKTVDCLLINSGGPPTGPFKSFADSDWQKAFDLLLMGAIRLIREALPAMEAKGKGSILVITSSVVIQPSSHLVLSSVMRSGVVNLIKTLSFDFAPLGIRINNLVPGRIETDRLEKVDQKIADTQNIPVETVRQRSVSTIPLGRYGNPAEIGRVGVFLLSEAASYITGATIVADGGMIRSI